MATKRDYDDVDDGEVTDDDPSPKRARKHTGAQPLHQHQNAAIDPTWGQKYVFSNISEMSTIPFGEESDFEDDADAMAYLRSVREQALGIPHMLVAPTRQIGPQLPPELRQADDETNHDDVEGDSVDYGEYPNTMASKGWYEDGAYIAQAESDGDDLASSSDEESSERDLHLAYFASILARYRRLRSILHAETPPGAERRISAARPTSAGPLDGKSATYKTWSTALRNTDPHPLQLALMSKDSVIRVLRVLLGGRFLRLGYTLTERTSQWVWALLARLPDPWELDHTDISWVRDLGRRAILLGRSLAEMAAMRDDLEEGRLGIHEVVDRSSSVEFGTDAYDCHGVGSTERSAGSEASGDPTHLAGKVQDAGQHDQDGKSAAKDVESDEEGQVSDDDKGDTASAAMDLSSGSDDGEVPAVRALTDGPDALEAAKQAFLARLDGDTTADAPDEESEEAQEAARLRLRINMRATLDMILTVAGDFYGQRDLLACRQPFVGI
ncbi:v-snare [Purpureocillium lavendulum]|uniref:V-snare n=1 Tax=Purpureocillium lavendulum TaxID=1247861 RepID=A0AB34G5T3_9HYPO|nr:v-snare [Purpureocillium lavendulum]